MRIGSPLPHRKARIEIIPLIDIMFFLLASFLMASLSMIRLQSKQVELPNASTAKRDFKPDIVNIAVDSAGSFYLEKTQVNLGELHAYLSNKFQVNTNVPVFISGDRAARHGDITKVLQMVRLAGIQKVCFTISPAEGTPPPQQK